MRPMGAFSTPSWLLPIKLPTFHRLPKRCAERKALNCLTRIIPYFRRFVAVVCEYARFVQASASPSEERNTLSLYPILQPRRKNLTREFKAARTTALSQNRWKIYCLRQQVQICRRAPLFATIADLRTFRCSECAYQLRVSSPPLLVIP